MYSLVLNMFIFIKKIEKEFPGWSISLTTKNQSLIFLFENKKKNLFLKHSLDVREIEETYDSDETIFLFLINLVKKQIKLFS